MMKKVECILLVDDDEATNYLNELMITELDLTEHLLQARNGKMALDLLQEHARQHQRLPNLILIDINMPVMDGFAFINAYRQLNLHSNPSLIAVLTTSPNASDMERVRNIGINDYIVKPLTEQTLLKLLEKL